MKKNNLILLSAGKSSRFKEGTSDKIKKQFFLLNDLPLFLHSLITFCNSNFFEKIILVIDSSEKEKYLKYINQYQNSFKNKNEIVFAQGGEHRYLSVWQGLQLIDKNLPFVFIHDSARPYITEKAISKMVNSLDEKNTEGLVPIESLVNSVKEVKENLITKHLNREQIKMVTTPQVFPSKLFFEVYNQFVQKKQENNIPTDDSEIYNLQYNIRTIELSCKNDKVTFKEDVIEQKKFRNKIN